MPQVAIGAVIAGAVSYATGATVMAAAAAAFGTLILGGISYALAPKPKKPQFNQPEVTGSTITLRQSDSTRKYIYGLTRYTDCYAHMHSTGVNGKLHGFIIICSGEAKSIDEIWVNDYPITPDMMDAQGNVISGRYAGNLRLRVHLGGPNQVADTVAISEVPDWTANDRGQEGKI
jgi:hypothetical protein